MENLRYIILILMLTSVLLGLLATVHQFIRRTGTVKANNSLAFLLLTFSLSLFNVLLLRTRFFGEYEHLYQVPLWFTLSFGPLLFFYVKFTLFPTYQFRGSDFKHLILPVLQFVFVFYVAFQNATAQHQIWENFIRPLYGPIEYSLFLIFFFVYATLSYRYIRYKLAKLRKIGFDWEKDRAWSLRKLVKRLAILAVIYSFFAVTDFVAFNFLNRDLYKVEGFLFLGDLAFTAMLLWLILSTYWKELTYRFCRKNMPQDDLFQQLEKQFHEQKLYRNPDLNTLRLAVLFRVSMSNIRQIVKKNTSYTIKEWLCKHRKEEAEKLIQQPKADMDAIAFFVGFRSRKEMRRQV